MTIDSPDTIDRIVANVLKKLGPSTKGTGAPTTAAKPASKTESKSTAFREKVITAELLDGLSHGMTVNVPTRAIITPSGWDVIRERNLKVDRLDTKSVSPAGPAASASPSTTTSSRLVIIVRNTDAVQRACEDLNGQWSQELLGCPDDAAKLAITELSRGSLDRIMVLAEQTHRAACLANRHEAVKAAVIKDVGDVKAVRKQLKVNTFCVDPSGRSYFELRNLFREITT